VHQRSFCGSRPRCPKLCPHLLLVLLVLLPVLLVVLLLVLVLFVLLPVLLLLLLVLLLVLSVLRAAGAKLARHQRLQAAGRAAQRCSQAQALVEEGVARSHLEAALFALPVLTAS
jgi:hypothetical protein